MVVTAMIRVADAPMLAPTNATRPRVVRTTYSISSPASRLEMGGYRAAGKVWLEL